MMTTEPSEPLLTIELRYLIGLIAIVAALFTGSVVEAHEGGTAADGLIAGLVHPLFGLDHLVAMVAVGLWGALLGVPALWLLPVIFPVIMAMAALTGMAGLFLPGENIGIALSILIIGAAIALAKRTPHWIAAIIVAIFAVIHGHAHGMELPDAANPFAFAAGFVLTTGLLHLCGMGLGLLLLAPNGLLAVRTIGGFIAAIGIYFLSVTV